MRDLVQLFKETIKTLKRLKEQEDAQRNRADSDASSEGSDEALNGSISDINGARPMDATCLPPRALDPHAPH